MRSHEWRLVFYHSASLGNWPLSTTRVITKNPQSVECPCLQAFFIGTWLSRCPSFVDLFSVFFDNIISSTLEAVQLEAVLKAHYEWWQKMLIIASRQSLIYASTDPLPSIPNSLLLIFFQCHLLNVVHIAEKNHPVARLFTNALFICNSFVSFCGIFWAVAEELS